MGRGSFTHLHVHTEYSMLDGAARIGEIQSLSLTSPDDDEAMSIVWTSLLGSPGPGGPEMAYDSRS